MTLLPFYGIMLAIVGAVLVAWVRFARRRPREASWMVDAQMRAIVGFERALAQLIRERYDCTDEQARKVRRAFELGHLDAVGTSYKLADDGQLRLEDDLLDQLDRCASDVGLRVASDSDKVRMKRRAPERF